MTNLKMARVSLVILSSLAIVESFGQNQNNNNWFTKSMDYFHYDECSSQEKSDLTAQFYGCLNTKSEGTGDKNDYNNYFKAYQGYMNGMSGGNMNSQVPDFINKFNPQNKVSESNGFQGDKKKVDKDSWAFKTCDELQEILRCMPALEQTECLTKKEHEFFSTMKYFFQAQSGYICSNKERISTAFEESTCNYMKNRQDISQQCFSINAQRLSYDWKVNFEDGVMCDLLKNLKNCEESYYDACEEQVRAYIRHSWLLPLQVTPCNSSLFEPMIDALSKDDKRSKRSVFNNQYGFKTADGNGNSYYRNLVPSNQDQADDAVENQEPQNLANMFSDVMTQMQKSGASAVRTKRSIDSFMGDYMPFNNKKSSKATKKDDKDSSDGGFNPMSFVGDNMKMNQDWASKFNSFGGGSSMDKSKKKSKKTDSAKTDSKKKDPKKTDSTKTDSKKDDSVKLESKKAPKNKNEKKDVKDDSSDKSMNPIETNKKINFDFAKKFSPFGRRKRSMFGGDDLPGMKQNQMFSDKFNPNPFFSNNDNSASKGSDDALNPIETNKKINFDFANKFGPFGRRKRSVFGGLPGMKQDKSFNNKFNPNPFTSDDDNTDTNVNPAEKQMGINDHFASEFGFPGKSIARSKRSADPYDESNPDEKDENDQIDSVDVKKDDKSDEEKSINEKQKDFSKMINQKFADHYKNKILGDKPKNETADDEDDKSPFSDLDKFVKERIKEQQKKELEKKEAKKKAKEESATVKDDSSMKLEATKSSEDKDDDSDDDKDDKTDFMKEIKKFVKEQIKKEMEKEKEKEKENDKEKKDKKDKKKKDKKKKEKLTEREKEELERKKERKQNEKERKKQKKEYEKEREKDELERKKEREQDEKERKKQKEEYEKEHGKKSTTSAPTTTEPPATTTVSHDSSSKAPTTNSPAEVTTSEPSTEQPGTESSVSKEVPKDDQGTTPSQSSSTDKSSNTESPSTDSGDTNPTTTDGKSKESTTQTADNTDSSTMRSDEIV